MKAILAVAALIAGVGVVALAQGGGQGPGRQNLPPPVELAAANAMNNPYRMLENWPHLGDIKPGAAIGIVPDGKGGVWLGHRSVPAILHIDASGNIVKKFDVTFASSHGLCQDRDGNFWAADRAPSATHPMRA